MEVLLIVINNKLHDMSGVLSEMVAQTYLKEYPDILTRANIECPAPQGVELELIGRFSEVKYCKITVM